MSYLENLTPEQREELREKSRLTKEAKKEAGKDLFQDFGDDLNHWKALASKAGVRMPASYLPNTEVKYVRRVANKLGIDMQEYLDACGVSNLKALARLNPNWSIVGEIGLLLEYWDENKGEAK